MIISSLKCHLQVRQVYVGLRFKPPSAKCEMFCCAQGTVFEPLSEEEVNRRKLAADEKTRAKLEKLDKRRERKQKQAGM